MMVAGRTDRGWMQVAEARVKAGIFVSAALRQCFARGGSGAVLRRGDEDAGGILALLRGREGLVVLSQVSNADGGRAWMRVTGDKPVCQEDADAYVTRQTARDPDLWVVEFDTPDYLPPFGGTVL
jgi:hypothetical protein